MTRKPELPAPKIEVEVHAPSLPIPELVPPSDFRSALALVQTLQTRFQSPESQADRLKARVLAAQLERAKRWAADLQQTPTVVARVPMSPLHEVTAEAVNNLLEQTR